MEKLPDIWIDRIFERLYEIYKDRWSYYVGTPAYEDRLKRMWSTGLAGLHADQIRRALFLCANYPYADTPTHIEFYHYAMGSKQLSSKRPPFKERASPESQMIAGEHLAEIRKKLRGNCFT